MDSGPAHQGPHDSRKSIGYARLIPHEDCAARDRSQPRLGIAVLVDLHNKSLYATLRKRRRSPSRCGQENGLRCRNRALQLSGRKTRHAFSSEHSPIARASVLFDGLQPDIGLGHCGSLLRLWQSKAGVSASRASSHTGGASAVTTEGVWSGNWICLDWHRLLVDVTWSVMARV